MTKQRINMDIERELWRQAKSEAAKQGKTLQQFVSESLERNLPNEPKRTGSKATVRS